MRYWYADSERVGVWCRGLVEEGCALGSPSSNSNISPQALYMMYQRSPCFAQVTKDATPSSNYLIQLCHNWEQRKTTERKMYTNSGTESHKVQMGKSMPDYTNSSCWESS